MSRDRSPTNPTATRGRANETNTATLFDAAADLGELRPCRFRPYPGLRPSGASWLGDVPSHWQQKRLKHAVSLINEKREADPTKRYVGLEHIEPWTGRLIDPPTEDQLAVESIGALFVTGDVLFGKLRPYLAKVVHANDAGCCTSELLVLRGRELQPRFLFYYLLSRGFIEVVDGSTFGSKMPRADWQFIGNQPALIPPLPEQDAIAAFLDRETARIDSLVVKKRRLVELLNEKRTALISRAVTKGLNPSAPTKPSGIDWLGNVPKHWTIHHLRRVVDRFFDYRGRTPEKSDFGVPLITAGAIKDGVINHRLAPEYIPESDYDEWMRRGLPARGDVVITTEAPLAEVAQVEDPSVAFAQRVILFKVNRTRMLPDFLRYYYLSINGKSELLSRASGSTALGIRADRLKRSLVLVPPLEEQAVIVGFLNPRLLILEQPVDRIGAAISQLLEYRSALITAAVTGKIDVRGEVKS